MNKGANSSSPSYIYIALNKNKNSTRKNISTETCSFRKTILNGMNIEANAKKVAAESYSKACKLPGPFVTVRTSINEEINDLIYCLEQEIPKLWMDMYACKTILLIARRTRSYKWTIKVGPMSTHISNGTACFCTKISIFMIQIFFQKNQHTRLVDRFIKIL